MELFHKVEGEASAAEPKEGAYWEEIGKEVTARLKAITRNVNRVLAQEGHEDKEVEHDDFLITTHR